MRGIADAQKSRAAPVTEPVDGHGQQFDIVPIAQLGDARFEEWRKIEDRLPETGQPVAANFLEAALGNHQRALPIIVAIDGDQNAPGFGVAERLFRIVRPAGDPHP